MHVADEGVSFAIVGGGGPVECDGRIGGYVEAIIARAFEGLSLFVVDRHQVVLTCSEMLGAEEDEGIGEAARVDGIAVRIGIVCLYALDEFRRAWEGPVGAFIEGGTKAAS